MRGFGKIKGGISLPATTALNSAVYGIYTAAEAEAYRKLGLWPTAPTTPGAPTNLIGTSGNSQVSLLWSAPAANGGAAITDYTVQYSSDSGSNWTTFSDGTSASPTATVTGLTNGVAHVFRVAATNSVGIGSYVTSDAITPAIIAALTIVTQPKNDYATAASQNITFSVTTSGGGTPTYQWQYFGSDEYNSDYEYRWRNFPSNATAASFVTSGNTLSSLLSYEFYYTAVVKLRCVVTAEGGASTLNSDEVRFVELDYMQLPSINWFGSQGSSTNYVNSTQPYTFSPAVGENLVLELYDMTMVYPDRSWYTGNNTTVKIQVATNGYTDSADWTDLHTQDFRGSVYISAYNITPSTGTKYYRAILIDKWPYDVNNGTQSATRTPQHVYTHNNSEVVQVTWPAVGYTVSGSADYSGSYPTSGTFDGYSPAWQHASNYYVLTWTNSPNSGWALFPGTLLDGNEGPPVAWQACGYPGGGSGTCTQGTATGTYSLVDGGSFTVT